MTILSIRKFNGEIPQLPADRLPQDAAQYAKNCDFTAQELRPLKGIGTHYTAAAGARPVRALFTDDGLRFFAWNKPTRAYLHPTIDDTVGRVIYLISGQIIGAFATAVAYWLGSSRGSVNKQRALEVLR